MVSDLQKFRWTLSQHPIAYMSAEFGLDDRLPIYSGGLGILAGDIIREANDMELPFVGVGLLYKEGYFKQVINDGQHEDYPLLDINSAPINLVVDTHDRPVKLSIPVRCELVHFQVWEYVRGDVSVFLLDTDVPENTPEHRLITRRLYGGDKETRILQELILGIGGVRALEALHIHPSIFHLNEGHSAFAIFEISYHYMKEYNMEFKEAYEYGRKKIVFTNHTLVPAGNELFQRDRVEYYLQCYAKQLGLEMSYVLEQGKVDGDNKSFSMPDLALTMAVRTNAVSKLHAEMAKKLWPNHHMVAITNGVHLPTWVSADIKAQTPKLNLYALANLDADQLWRLHEMAKYRLLDEVEYRTGKRLEKDHLIITWARRFASYKQPELLFTDIERLKNIIFHAHHPVQFIFAGKAHPRDVVGHETIKNIIRTIKEHGLENHVIFVPNYNMKLADVLVSGSDVWLNTPIFGQEASGTSGMKASANGVLQCSVSDGWVYEVALENIGWELPKEHTTEALYELLEQSIAPLFYGRDKQNVPVAWVQRMKKTIAMVWEDFSSRRMVEDYIEKLYRPTLELEIKEKHHHNWRDRYRVREV